MLSTRLEQVPALTLLPLQESPAIAHALVVSKDPDTTEQIARVLNALAISTETSSDASAACNLLQRRKFEMVVVDFDLGEEAPSILGEMRVSPSNRTAPAMAITRSKADLAVAYCAGSTFLAERPLSLDALNRTLIAGYGLVVRERRRYFRCPVRARVALRRADMRQAQSHSVNVSEGGMEIMSAPAKLMPGVRVQVEFELPGLMDKFRAASETVWRDRRGHAGLRFLLLPLEQRCDLQEWLARKLEDGLPEQVAERFRRAIDRHRAG